MPGVPPNCDIQKWPQILPNAPSAAKSLSVESHWFSLITPESIHTFELELNPLSLPDGAQHCPNFLKFLAMSYEMVQGWSEGDNDIWEESFRPV